MQLKERVKHYRAESEFAFREGCFINELSNSPGDPLVSIARARLPAGQTTRWHHLTDIIERYLILEGEGRVEIGDGLVEQVRYGDAVLIPQGVRQRITALGQQDLVFLAICTPRFSASAYVDLEP